MGKILRKVVLLLLVGGLILLQLACGGKDSDSPEDDNSWDWRLVKIEKVDTEIGEDEDKKLFIFNYDDKGELVSFQQKDPESGEVVLSLKVSAYGDNGYPSEMVYSYDSREFIFDLTYDDNNRLIKFDNDEFIYNSDNFIICEKSVDTAYDRVSEISYEWYAYANGRMSREDSTGGLPGTSYDTSDDGYITYEHNDDGVLTSSVEYEMNSDKMELLKNTSYEYDENGLLHSVKSVENDEGTTTISYTWEKVSLNAGGAFFSQLCENQLICSGAFATWWKIAEFGDAEFTTDGKPWDGYTETTVINPLSFTLKVGTKEYTMKIRDEIELQEDDDITYYELTADSSDGNYFRLRLPENVAASNTYTDVKMGSTFTLYLWEDSADRNWYSYDYDDSLKEGTISTVVSKWDYASKKCSLSFDCTAYNIGGDETQTISGTITIE